MYVCMILAIKIYVYMCVYYIYISVFRRLQGLCKALYGFIMGLSV